MMSSREFLKEVRDKLRGLNEHILNHPLLRDAEAGKLPLDRIKLFISNQYYIVHHDIRSLALMVSRTSDEFEAEYMTKLQNGDMEAFKALKKMGEEMGVEFRNVQSLDILPEAVAYTHYLAWLALYANPGEQVFALIVNLPVWGGACKRLADALRRNYGVVNTDFLDFFGNIPEWVEVDGLRIIDRYLPSSRERMLLFAKTIQGYESMFWDGVYRGGGLGNG